MIKENKKVDDLHSAMKNTYQFGDIDMYQHGEMVFNEYQKMMNAIKNKDTQYIEDIGFSFDKNFIEKLFDYQYDMEIMRNYQIYHDCGKHLSRIVDNNGKVHYPDHAQHSSNIYGQYFDNPIVQELILKDLNFHTFKSEEIIEWIKKEDKYMLASLYITAWAEILANATMFGGINSDSFKIKRKKLIQNGKKLKEIYK